MVFTASDTRHIQRVQNNFLRFAASHVLKTPCLPHDYSPVVNVLGLVPAVERKRTADLLKQNTVKRQN